ncbi:NAD-dependent epimerase/dehydratase family protein [Cohnella sp. CFH 77786]|uniref:NAD-dependent epimerase/dehydratase family protein n=1 Tax=Cohnella sp. CFH 77786 TaxID=2662265 RepID=UPI001C60B290|nr:NAD-dependent epimerase/dehydratase family protein [Cohnella sp. CFH 77786]MBW5446517.1 NAD-dependent epimerase/dehydratase family protein [Cohnella sp. CFH 77786]
MVRALVTGGAGFIGSRLAHALVARGEEVWVLDDLSSGNKARVPSGCKFIEVNVTDRAVMRLIGDIRPSIVFHLAAQVGVSSSVRAPEKDALINVIGTIHVWEGCRKAGAKLVFSSTAAVYGTVPAGVGVTEHRRPNPTSPYGLSKKTAEDYIRLGGSSEGGGYSILRYSNVYGEGQTTEGEGGVIALFRDRIRRGLPLIIHGDGNQRRDFIHVDDVVQANLAAIGRGSGGVYNISSGISVSIKQLATLCQKLSGHTDGCINEPPRPGDIRYSRLSPARARAELEWRPEIDLDAGLAALIK